MVYLFLAPGFEEIEALTPVDILRRAGVEVTTVAIGTDRTVRGSHGISVTADTDEAHLSIGTVEAVILPGGMPGAANLDASATVDRLLREADRQKALLCAICAAPLVLGHRGYLSGKKAVCYPGFEKELHGALPAGGQTVLRDGNVLTAVGMGVALPFSLAIVEALRGGAAAEKIAAGIQY